MLQSEYEMSPYLSTRSVFDSQQVAVPWEVLETCEGGVYVEEVGHLVNIPGSCTDLVLFSHTLCLCLPRGRRFP